jgi:hypothetical protein
MSSEDNTKTASVNLDKNTLLQFESHLRDQLVASQFFLAAENKAVTTTECAPSTVTVDAAQAARLSEQLRQHLVDTNAISSEDHEALNKLTSQVK